MELYGEGQTRREGSGERDGEMKERRQEEIWGWKERKEGRKGWLCV